MKKINAYSVYDDPEFFRGYKDLRMNDKGLNGKMEEPAIRKLIGEIKGKSVLDIGCGFGHQLLWLTRNGAERVVGIDPSKKMLESAKRLCVSSEIELIHGHFQDIEFKDKFDHIISSMAFHYICDLEKLFQKCYDDLTCKGKLTFSIEHPVCTANTDGYQKDSEGMYWCLKDYHEEGKRKFNWFINGVTKYHRTLKTIINTLIFSGFRINAIDEPYPLDRNYSKKERIKDYFWVRPSILLIDSEKS